MAVQGNGGRFLICHYRRFFSNTILLPCLHGFYSCQMWLVQMQPALYWLMFSRAFYECRESEYLEAGGENNHGRRVSPARSLGRDCKPDYKGTDGVTADGAAANYRDLAEVRRRSRVMPRRLSCRNGVSVDGMEGKSHGMTRRPLAVGRGVIHFTS